MNEDRIVDMSKRFSDAVERIEWLASRMESTRVAAPATDQAGVIPGTSAKASQTTVGVNEREQKVEPGNR